MTEINAQAALPTPPSVEARADVREAYDPTTQPFDEPFRHGGQPAEGNAERLRQTLPGITCEAFRGDNLAIFLASEFEPGVESEEMDQSETWKQEALDLSDQVLNAIHAHYAPALAALESAPAEPGREAVAWRFKHKHVVNDRWRFNDRPPEGEPWTCGEPLYATPPDAAAEIERLTRERGAWAHQSGVNLGHYESEKAMRRRAEAELAALKAETDARVKAADAGMGVMASLAAAISVLERTPRAKKAAASDRMFDQMLDDYRRALDRARADQADLGQEGQGG